MFNSFFLGGFEGTVVHNRWGEWIDGVAATQHDSRLREDYILLREAGIRTARECVRWPVVDSGGKFDLRSLDRILDVSRRVGMQIVFDLFHFGYPCGLNILSPEFPKRFADYCFAVARRVANAQDGPSFFTPINEPSYFAWCAGEVGLFPPYLKGRGADLKLVLAEAALRGIEAIWEGCPDSRIVNVDPFCHVFPPVADDGVQQEEAHHFNSSVVFESWDTLAGLRHSELGGSRRHLDIVGVNYYWTNQWEMGRAGVPLTPDDPRLLSITEIVLTVWQRYGNPMVITETSHVDEHRETWMHRLGVELESSQLLDIPLAGVCWYPVFEMAEWHSKGEWRRMGLWDFEDEHRVLKRIPHEPVLRALRDVQQRVEKGSCLVERFGIP